MPNGAASSRLTDSLTHRLIDYATHGLGGSPTHRLTDSPTRRLADSSTHRFTDSSIHRLTHSPTSRLADSWTQRLTDSPTHRFTDAPTHRPLASSTSPIRSTDLHAVLQNLLLACFNDWPVVKGMEVILFQMFPVTDPGFRSASHSNLGSSRSAEVQKVALHGWSLLRSSANATLLAT